MFFVIFSSNFLTFPLIHEYVSLLQFLHRLSDLCLSMQL
eukprot:UN27186